MIFAFFIVGLAFIGCALFTIGPAIVNAPKKCHLFFAYGFSTGLIIFAKVSIPINYSHFVAFVGCMTLGKQYFILIFYLFIKFILNLID